VFSGSQSTPQGGIVKDSLIQELTTIKVFFERSTECLAEEDSTFRPQDGMLTVVQQVAHVAQCIDWFIEGMQDPKGFNMDFEKHWQKANKCPSLEAARSWFAQSIDQAIEVITKASEEELALPLPEGPVMGGQAKSAVIGAISDHTAHHRGSLTVYSRLLGKEPRMPYM
jgi:uncharacterized damage-inducible protein DinB